MNYRFKPEDFKKCALPERKDLLELMASEANTTLEQWEAESEKVYARSGEAFIGKNIGQRVWVTHKKLSDTHSAILWHPRKIGEE